jgi:membrane fusion protein, copper/silver efflux system
MALVPLEGEPNSGEPGVLKLTDRQVQQAGVRIGSVRPRALAREIDATGKVEINHERLATITSWIPGRSRIDRLHAYYTGDNVEQGQVLAELYSSTLSSSLEDYRLALKGYLSIKVKGEADAVDSARRLVESAKARLVRFGLAAEQVAGLSTENPSNLSVPTVSFRSPITGTLIEPAAVKEGGYVVEGGVLFRVADLSVLWLFVDIYEYELPFVSVGQTVSIATRSLPGETFEGKIAIIEPIVKERTRTIRVRCTLDNREGKLKPGMFARVGIRSVIPDMLAVPESAVLQSGRRNVVIVSEGDGRFRPKMVRLGRRYLYPARGSARTSSRPSEDFAAEDRYHEVLSGLSDGDRVVVAGNFLLNAEAQFQGILKKMIEATELAEKAPKVPDAVRIHIDAAIEKYLALGSALVNDSPKELSALADEVGRIAQKAKEQLSKTEHPQLDGLLERLRVAAASLVGEKEPDLKLARKHFAALSREVLTYLRDYSPGRVANGELHVFRCGMANDQNHQFGYELWVQKEPEIKNPYMGQMMLT